MIGWVLALLMLEGCFVVSSGLKAWWEVWAVGEVWLIIANKCVGFK